MSIYVIDKVRFRTTFKKKIIVEYTMFEIIEMIMSDINAQKTPLNLDINTVIHEWLLYTYVYILLLIS